MTILEVIDLGLVAGDLSSILSLMKAHGSSVSLNYGEDNGMWECSWITGGRRFTNHSTNAEVATRRVLNMVRGELVPSPTQEQP